MLNSYHFVTRWQIDATPEEVYRTLEDAESLSRWWPSVYLDVATLEPGAPGGVGKVIDLYTKGWLPYTLRWKFRVTRAEFPVGFSLEAEGDFVGTGVWTFMAEGDGCLAVYDWRIDASKPLLRALSFMMKPIFSANHRWAMERGLESLKLELRRRHGEENVPAPPQPTFPHNLLKRRVRK